MARSRRAVIGSKAKNADRLPDWASEGSVLVEWMHGRGVLDEIGARLRIQREGGYTGLDLILFLLFFLSSRVDGGIKGFGAHAAHFRERLGALGGRRRIPTPASVSRILAAAEPSHCETLSEWLLFEGCDATPILSHPSVVTRDAKGEGWHVFDLDPTTTVLRQRALPDRETTPPPRRRSASARAGYRGRKRGDVQFSRMTLQHSGTSLWMGLWTGPGNGEWREHSDAAVRRVRSICERMKHSADRALVRVDGAGGNVPFFTACAEAGVHYLTRWSRYEILDEADIRAHLNGACWTVVADSGSGPRRQATEIGWMTVDAGQFTVRDDGSTYAPQRARIIVSRFQARQADSKRGAGRLIDGWQYELYATTLEAAAWPADDVVTAYYGRSGLENRFCQEDKSIGLDHIFSYEVAGQQLANLVGLFLWNLRVCRGFELAKVPVEVPAQQTRVAGNVELGPLLAVAEPLTPEQDPPEEATTSTVPSTPEPPEETMSGRAAARAQLQVALDSLDWVPFLDGKPGWRWDTTLGLTCPKGEAHSLQSVKVRAGQTHQLRFVARYQVCSACSFRPACTLSANKLFRKETTVVVPSDVALPIRQLLDRVHDYPRRALPRPPPPRPDTTARRAPAPAPVAARPSRETSWRAPGPLAVTAAILLPAKLRRIFARACRTIEVHVRVSLPERPRQVEVFALTPSERQNRRLTWAQRSERYALPADSEVQLVISGHEEIESILQLTGSNKSLHSVG